MKAKEYEVLAEYFNTPCDHGKEDLYLLSKSDWCDRFCGIVSGAECWRHWLDLKLKEQR